MCLYYDERSSSFETYAALDSDDGIVYYDVEFRSGDYEYNYDIDAKSGALLERDIDKELF